MYSRQFPFMAAIKSRYLLSQPGSQKQTHHIVLDLKQSGLKYDVGDSIGIWPKHDPQLIYQTLQALNMQGTELVSLKDGHYLTLKEALTAKIDITTVSFKLVKAVCERQSNYAKKEYLQDLLQEEKRDAFKAYVQPYFVWDFLQSHAEVQLTPQELVDLLMPLLPRFYSISSSQNHVGDEVHLTVAPVSYMSNGYERQGVCTHYLCKLTPLNEHSVPIFVQPAHSFKLPEDQTIPLIMIGPGTGIAPFRAFLQERILYQKSHGQHWLFFGERNQAYDFYYQHEWNTFAQKGHLRIETAFSRDQVDKIYVQHRLLEQGRELYQWLERGAYLYVCGDAQRMAKDVEQTLQLILQEHGQQDGREAIKRLRQQKRYLRDVY